MKNIIQKIKMKFYNTPLMGKLISLLVIASLIPLLFISSYTYQRSKQQLINQKYDSINNTNIQINNNIENQFETYLQISSLLYTDANLKGYITKEYTADIEYVRAYYYINNLFYSLLSANHNVKNITLYVHNTTIPTDGLFVKHVYDNMAYLEWLNTPEAAFGNNIYSGMSNNQDGDLIFSIGRILNYNSLNYPYGYLVIEINEDIIYSMIEAESQTKDIYIVDSVGQIISTKNKSLISKNIEDMLSTKIFTNETALKQILKIDNRKVLVTYSTMKNDWKTVTAIHLNDIIGEAALTSNQILLVSLFCIVISIFLIYVISRYFSQRFKDLNKQISMVKNEDFSYQISHNSSDEMGQLSSAINAMAKKLDMTINELYKKEIAKKRAELFVLQNQINPHFLYNTLSGISSLALRNDDKQVGEIVNHLSQFYKTTLNQGKQFISIENELQITKHYIAIQNMRFKDMFIVRWEIDKALYPYQTIKLILQPFVENIVNHAIADDEKHLNIYIRLYRVGDSICFEVEDDGIGMEKEKVDVLLNKNHEFGYGIMNVNERIKLSYGDEYGIDIASTQGHGTTILIKIPIA